MEIPIPGKTFLLKYSPLCYHSLALSHQRDEDVSLTLLLIVRGHVFDRRPWWMHVHIAFFQSLHYSEEKQIQLGLWKRHGTTLYPDSKVHGANMGPTWGRQDPGGPHVGHMNLAIWVCYHCRLSNI